MAKAKKDEEKPLKPADKIEIKESEDFFPGGASVNLDQETEAGNYLRDELALYLSRLLNDELKSQGQLEENLREWQKQYRGDKDPKSFPWAGCANVSIPLTRWLIDNIVVRIIEAIFGQKKVWMLRARKKEFTNLVEPLEDGLDWWQRWIIDFKKMIFSPILQAIKTGTGVVKISYRKEPKTVYRYASDEEKENKDLKKYKTDADPVVKDTLTKYDGVYIESVPREDFIISSEATSIDTAFMVGMRTYLREPQLKARVKSGLYYPGTYEQICAGDSYDDIKKDRAEGQGKVISEVKDKPIEIWELWLKYDVDNDGIEDDIVVVYHRKTGTILRAIYNPYFYGFRPFVDLVFNPVEYSFDGDGLCQVLESIQDEVDTIHNQRLDRMTLINSLVLLAREGSTQEKFDIYPGATIWVDDVTSAVQELKFSDQYPSTFNEEGLLMQYAQYVTGISPEAMGQPTAERPVAKEAMARLQQVGVKVKYGTENIRRQISKIGMRALCMFGQYQPHFRYEKQTKDGLFQSQTVEFPAEFLEEGINIDLYASSEMLNTEVRREINLTVYQLLSDYVTKMASMIQALTSAGVHQELKKYIIDVAEMSRKIVTRILDDFDIVDAEDLLKPLEQIINVQNAVMTPTPPQGPPQGGGGPPPQGMNPPQGM